MDGRSHLRAAPAERIAHRHTRPVQLREARLHARELVLAGTLSQEDADQILGEFTVELERLGVLRVLRTGASATVHVPMAAAPEPPRA